MSDLYTFKEFGVGFDFGNALCDCMGRYIDDDLDKWSGCDYAYAGIKLLCKAGHTQEQYDALYDLYLAVGCEYQDCPEMKRCIELLEVEE